MTNKMKIGVSALCGSLAAVASAQAGDMSVSGTATATWVTGSQTTNGNPIGMNSGLTFKGTGELDNGTAVTYVLTHADKAAYSVGSISLAMPSMGTIAISHASGGGGLGGYDDKMPTAWEETWGNAVGTSVNLQKGVGSSANIMWTLPTMMGITTKVAVAPRNDGSQANDKASTGAANSEKGRGYDVVFDMAPIEGSNVWVGYSHTDNNTTQIASPFENIGDHEEVNVGGTFTFGPAKIGVAKTAEFTGYIDDASVEYYNNLMYGISFAVSDNLSLSYGMFESQKKVNKGFTADMEVASYQAAYTMGGAAFKLAKTDVDNAGYSTAKASQKEATTLAMSLAF